MFQSSFVSNQLQRDRFSSIGNFFCVIAIKQKPDKDEVSDKRLFCDDRRRIKRRFERRGELDDVIMLDKIMGGMDTPSCIFGRFEPIDLVTGISKIAATI